MADNERSKARCEVSGATRVLNSSNPLVICLEQLTLAERMQASAVSSNWCKVAQHPHVWKNLCMLAGRDDSVLAHTEEMLLPGVHLNIENLGTLSRAVMSNIEAHTCNVTLHFLVVPDELPPSFASLYFSQLVRASLIVLPHTIYFGCLWVADLAPLYHARELMVDIDIMERRSAFEVAKSFPSLQGFCCDANYLKDEEFPLLDVLSPQTTTSYAWLNWEGQKEFQNAQWPCMESLGILSSALSHSDYGQIFGFIEKCARRMKFLAISSDTCHFKRIGWKVFSNVPASVEVLLLDFDDCSYGEGLPDEAHLCMLLRQIIPARSRFYVSRSGGWTSCNVMAGTFDRQQFVDGAISSDADITEFMSKLQLADEGVQGMVFSATST